MKRTTTYLAAGVLLLAALCPLRADNVAPRGRGPGPSFHWAPAKKDFLGTAFSKDSHIYFTGAEGILTEIFYPSPDIAQNVDLQLLVVDAAGTYTAAQAEEKQQTDRKLDQPDPRAMLWVSTITDARPGVSPAHWETRKEIYTDPHRNSVIQDITFRVLDPTKSVKDFNVYILNKPAINIRDVNVQNATHNNSRTLKFQKAGAPLDGRNFLCASLPDNTSAALISSVGWKVQELNGEKVEMISSGYVGVNDGWTDLFGPGNDRHEMKFHFDGAYDGNIAQMGWLDFGASTAKEISFKVIYSFGQSEGEAMSTANDTLSNFTDLKKDYLDGWHSYTNGLKPGMEDEFYLAAMTLKSSADKDNGAMVAGMGTPWGEGTDDTSGYHRVWARDLFKFSSALFSAGDIQAAKDVVTFLFQNQQNKTFNSEGKVDGHLPRFGFTSGLALEQGNVQMDQTALPIVLAWRLAQVDPNILKTDKVASGIVQAADYLVNHGPFTITERWEEQAGYSPSTIAAEIAGLVCAADLVEKNHLPDGHPADYLRLADYWRGNLATWLVTDGGPLNTKKPYYLRLDVPQHDPDLQNPDSANSGDNVNGSNSIPSVAKRRMVDGGFLELVRLGVSSADDWAIRSSIEVTDGEIKQTVESKYDGFFRYNYDGYGQQNNGNGWNSRDGGRGRLWPILTAERGIYEIQQAQNGTAGAAWVASLDRFTGKSVRSNGTTSTTGFIPEQVFGNHVTFHSPEVDVENPAGVKPGDATGSIRPLSWAMGEYINLMLASKLGHNDAPQVVLDRYQSTKPQVKVNFVVTADTVFGEHMDLIGETPVLGDNNEQAAIRLKPLNYPKWNVSVSLPAGAHYKCHFFKHVPGQANVEGASFDVFADPAHPEVDVQKSFP